jgi:hypothetical protein
MIKRLIFKLIYIYLLKKIKFNKIKKKININRKNVDKYIYIYFNKVFVKENILLKRYDHYKYKLRKIKDNKMNRMHDLEKKVKEKMINNKNLNYKIIKLKNLIDFRLFNLKNAEFKIIKIFMKDAIYMYYEKLLINENSRDLLEDEQ